MVVYLISFLLDWQSSRAVALIHSRDAWRKLTVAGMPPHPKPKSFVVGIFVLSIMLLLSLQKRCTTSGLVVRSSKTITTSRGRQTLPRIHPRQHGLAEASCQRRHSSFLSTRTIPSSHDYMYWKASTTTCLRSFSNDDEDDHYSFAAEPPEYDDDYDSNAVLLEDLNDHQVQAVTQPLHSVTRVVAGPGSGKTAVLVRRIAYLLMNDEDDESRILAVTFTRKAAGEMQERIHNLLTPDNDENDDAPPVPALQRVTLGTFHSICAKILRWNGDHLASLPSVVRDMTGVHPMNATRLDGNFAIADQAGQVQLIRRLLKELEEEELARDDNSDEKSDDSNKPKPLNILSQISKIKEEYAVGADFMGNNDDKDQKKKKAKSSARLAAERLYYKYRIALLSQNTIDFDDLILMARELLVVHPFIRERLNQRWRHVLVDEFQDTSKVQMDLVKRLTTSSLFVVGDADQSIYSWRGANADSLASFDKDFEHFLGHVDTVYLMENYRSTSNIVSVAQKVIASGGSKDSANAQLRQDMLPKRGSGPSPRVIACADDDAEASLVVDTILEMTAAGNLSETDSIAMLYRTNAQSRHLEEACVAKQIPYVIRGGAGGFYKRAEIKDCLCYLRWLANGFDEISMTRAFENPSKGIGVKSIEEFKNYCKEIQSIYNTARQGTTNETGPSPLDVLLSLADEVPSNITRVLEDVPAANGFISKRALKSIVAFGNKMQKLHEMAQDKKVSDLIDFILKEFDFEKHLKKISKTNLECEERKENVQELRRASERYGRYGVAIQKASGNDDMESESPLSQFLDDIALVTEINVEDDDEGEEGKAATKKRVVNLMTIHASKGMEFDCVFLVGMEEGTLPSYRSFEDDDSPNSVAMDEEKRLCYVGVTRARTHLIMTWRRNVSMFRGWLSGNTKSQTRTRSRFLEALVKNKKGGDNKKDKGKERSRDNASSHRKGHGQRKVVPVQKRPSRDYVSASEKTLSEFGSRTIPRDAMLRRRTSSRPEAPKRRRSESPIGSSTTTTQRKQSKDDDDDKVVVDSTWMYPIGSNILHTKLGKGQVLPPDDKGMVRVRFESTGNSESVMDFPVASRELLPDLGF